MPPLPQRVGSFIPLIDTQDSATLAGARPGSGDRPSLPPPPPLVLYRSSVNDLLLLLLLLW